MTISSKLDNALSEASNKVCKLMTIINNSSLSDDDKKKIEIILSVPDSNPTKVPNSTLAKILREEGYDVSNSLVDRHRRNDCPCSRQA